MNSKPSLLLTPASRKVLLSLARSTLEQWLRFQKKTVPEGFTGELQKTGHGIFVTLKNREELRGCIGCLSSEEPLWKLVMEYAVESSRDSRFTFQPVRYAELKELTLEISLLSPLRQIQDYRETLLGTHGIVIEKGWKRGVFLPQVAEETGWTLEEYWENLATHKAGLPANAYKNGDALLYVFEALVFSERDFSGL